MFIKRKFRQFRSKMSEVFGHTRWSWRRECLEMSRGEISKEKSRDSCFPHTNTCLHTAPRQTVSLHTKLTTPGTIASCTPHCISSYIYLRSQLLLQNWAADCWYNESRGLIVCNSHANTSTSLTRHCCATSTTFQPNNISTNHDQHHNRTKKHVAMRDEQEQQLTDLTDSYLFAIPEVHAQNWNIFAAEFVKR